MKLNSKILGLAAFSALGLIFACSSIAATTACNQQLSSSDQCLFNVNGGNGGNVDVAYMNMNNGAFGYNDWEQVGDTLNIIQNNESGNTAVQGNSVFSFTREKTDWKSGKWYFNGGFLSDEYDPESNYALALKGSTSSAVYLITSTNGNWNVLGLSLPNNSGGNPELSNVKLFKTASAVPIPAAAYLFGSALLGLVGIGYRRSKKQA